MPIPVDWSDDKPRSDDRLPPLTKPGCYHAEVAVALDRRSKKGDRKVTVKFVAVDIDRRELCWVDIMLEGKGWHPYGKPAVLALGVKKGEPIEPESLVGRRVWLHLTEDDREGKTGLVLDTARGTHRGYSVDRPDVGVVEEEPPANVGDDFFSEAEDGEIDGTPF